MQDPDPDPDPAPHLEEVTVVRGSVSVTAVDARSVEAPGVPLEVLARLLADTLTAEGVDWPAEASLTVVDAAEMAELNLEHMDKDGPTDVLSFPLDGRDATGAGEDTPAMVGDLVVCAEVAASNAPEHAGTPEDELALLVVHGGLHLLGWDHATLEDQTAMWARERELLPALHRPPARDPWVDDTGVGT